MSSTAVSSFIPRLFIPSAPKESGYEELGRLVAMVREDTLTVSVEERINLRSGEAAQDDGLSVVLGPSVERPHPHSREVCAM